MKITIDIPEPFATVWRKMGESERAQAKDAIFRTLRYYAIKHDVKLK